MAPGETECFLLSRTGGAQLAAQPWYYRTDDHGDEKGLANSRIGLVLVTPALRGRLPKESVADKELSACLARNQSVARTVCVSEVSMAALKVGSIVIRVDDLQRQTQFWAAALDYVPRDVPAVERQEDLNQCLARPSATRLRQTRRATTLQGLTDLCNRLIADANEVADWRYSRQGWSRSRIFAAVRIVNALGSRPLTTAFQSIGIDTGAPARARGDKGATAVAVLSLRR